MLPLQTFEGQISVRALYLDNKNSHLQKWENIIFCQMFVCAIIYAKKNNIMIFHFLQKYNLIPSISVVVGSCICSSVVDTLVGVDVSVGSDVCGTDYIYF